jgi:hypothetical protein
MTKREHDQMLHDGILDLIKRRKEEAAKTSAIKPLSKKDGLFKRVTKKVLGYFTT